MEGDPGRSTRMTFSVCVLLVPSLAVLAYALSLEPIHCTKGRLSVELKAAPTYNRELSLFASTGMTLGDDLPDVKPHFPFGVSRPDEPPQRWSSRHAAPAKQARCVVHSIIYCSSC